MKSINIGPFFIYKTESLCPFIFIGFDITNVSNSISSGGNIISSSNLAFSIFCLNNKLNCLLLLVLFNILFLELLLFTWE